MYFKCPECGGENEFNYSSTTVYGHKRAPDKKELERVFTDAYGIKQVIETSNAPIFQSD